MRELVNASRDHGRSLRGSIPMARVRETPNPRDVIRNICDRFPYLSVDISSPARSDHPQVLYRDENHFDLLRAEQRAMELNAIALQWSLASSIDVAAEFGQGLDGLRGVIRATSATSLILRKGTELLVERPGMEVDKSRRGEVADFVETTCATWVEAAADQRLALARLCLLGIGPHQLELVNYLDVSQIPNVLGRMIARLDWMSPNIPKDLDALEWLQRFYEIEQRSLSEAGLGRITIPGGTRPRIYVPKSAISPDGSTFTSAKCALDANGSLLERLSRFLELIWSEFSDEGFLVLHEEERIHALALIGGCIYSYLGVQLEANGKVEVKNVGVPQFRGTAGTFQPRPWRRQIERLCFDGGTPALKEFRSEVISAEKLAPMARVDAGKGGIVAKAAQKLLTRQINYNMSHVLNGQMERISADEWAPYMCRDQFGRVYNPAHALAGVGEMFRSLLTYGGRFSQFRCWREIDGTHGFSDMTKYLGYKSALDEFLCAQPLDTSTL
jgi:hypothetical protein